MLCPICGTEIDEDTAKLAERLGSWGYMHLDVWLKCPKCKYTPAFGKELSDPKPIYWRPEGLATWFKKKVVEAFHKHTPPLKCPFPNCGSPLQLHKIWVHSWKSGDILPAEGQAVDSDGAEDVRNAFQFIVTQHGGKGIHKYFIPAGIMSQYKCTNWRCKYVRYVTL